VTYSVRAFAELAGVTVKALHYYERRGLLAPRRTRAGYRRYTLRDLARLERIIALKKLGLPLKQITRLRSRETMASFGEAGSRQAPRAPADTNAPADGKEREASAERAAPGLDAHREKLVEKRRLIGEEMAAIDAVARAGDPQEALQKFVGETSWNRWEAKRAQMADPAPRAPDRASPSRFALFHEIKDALDRDPSGATAQPLVARWNAVIEAEADGNPETIAKLRKISATRAKWPDGARRYVASLYDTDVDAWERVMDFIAR